MGKQNVPVKARKAGTTAGGNQHNNNSSSGSNKKKHGGIGSNNAFENLTYRSKHEVLQLGKAKGKVKRPSASLSNSLAQRQAALLAELGSRDKTNSFTDERIQEADDTIDAEDKLLLRFQKERQKRLANYKFNMGEDEQDTLELTHLGQALSKTPAGKKYTDADFEEGAEPPEEDEAFSSEREPASAAEGEENEEESKESSSGHVKSKHEVMSEVMLKSKMYRAERAVLAEEQSDLMGNLDADFDAIRSSMEFVTNADREAERRATKEAERKATAAIAAAKKAKADKGEADEDAMEIDFNDLDPTDEFVLEARQLGFDVRAKATDRLKTDEELIAQEKKRLERLEKLRLKRMRGESAPGELEADEDAMANEDEPAAKRRRRERKEMARAAAAAKNRKPTDDDLDANFTLTKKGLDGEKDEHDLLSDDEGEHGEEDEDEDDDEEDDEEDGEDDEDEDDEDDEEDEDDDDAGAQVDPDAPIKAVFIGDPNKNKDKAAATPAAGFKEIFIGKDGKSNVSNELLALTNKLMAKQAGVAAAGAETKSKPATKAASSSMDDDSNLPFTFAAPSSYKEFRQLLNSYPLSQHSLIIHRILTCNHISLAPENRGKMDKFFALLLVHFRRLIQDFQRAPAAQKTAQTVQELVSKLDSTGRHISEMLEIPSMNLSCAKSFRAQINKIRNEFEGLKDDESNEKKSSAAPTTLQVDHIFFFKLVFNLFPSSDFRHNIITPTFLLIGEMLNRMVVHSSVDLMRGFLLISTGLHALSSSKRFMPELLTFLHASFLFGLNIQQKETELIKAQNESAREVAASKKAGKAAPATPTVFQVLPSSVRSASSLQSRNVNFVPSSTLAVFSQFIQPSAAAPSKKASKKSALDEVDLHIPLEYLFFDADNAALTSPTLAAQLFSTLLQLIHQSTQLYQKDLPSYAEVFLPIMDSINHVLTGQKNGKFGKIPSNTLQQYLEHLFEYFKNSSQHSISLRQPLQASLAPLALKTHMPIFQEGYNPTKDYDPIKERAQTKELEKKLKKEKKGALRELRRDTAVVVQQQRAIQQAYAVERESKRKEAWQQMEEQARDSNIMQKASKKKERKEGKKKH